MLISFVSRAKARSFNSARNAKGFSGKVIDRFAQSDKGPQAVKDGKSISRYAVQLRG